jgi:TonB family protein
MGFAAKKDLTIRIWLFQGTSMGDQPGLQQIEILPISTTPELAALKALTGSSEDVFKSAAVENLLEAKNLKTLVDLFFFKQTQREDFPFPGKAILGRQTAYRLDFFHKMFDSAHVGLRIFLSKTKEGVVGQEKDDRTMLRKAFEATQDSEKMDNILDREFDLRFDEPVLVGIPHQNRFYYMIVKLSANEQEIKPKKTPILKAPLVPNLLVPPQALIRVIPLYPDGLRRRGIKGEVGLRVFIDEQGKVQLVQILSSLHPYLDYAAVRAIRQWRFEPSIQKGKPAPAAFNYAFNFDPQVNSEGSMLSWDIPAGPIDAANEELARILVGCGDYCRKLAKAALFYICEETIKETTYSLLPPDLLAEVEQRAYFYQVNESSDGRLQGWVSERPQILSSRNIERIAYSCDYQLFRRTDDFEERRIILKDNGHKITDRVELLGEKRYSVLSPISSTLAILGQDRQFLFKYQIIKEVKIYGKNAVIIESLPRSGDVSGIQSARVWIDKSNFQILKIEIEGVPIEGYDDVLGEAVQLNIEPLFLRTYEFRIEKNGFRFPERTTVQVEYPSFPRSRREIKSKIELSYKNFKYFMVETGYDTKK